MITNVMRARLLVLMILTAVSCFSADLSRDDFSHFPPGWLTSPVGTLNGAIQEYHYLPNRGVPLGPWANAIGHLDAWVVGSEEGKPYLKEQLDPAARQWTPPIFIYRRRGMERLQHRSEGKAAEPCGEKLA
jgi:hypothetical protein